MEKLPPTVKSAPKFPLSSPATSPVVAPPAPAPSTPSVAPASSTPASDGETTALPAELFSALKQYFVAPIEQVCDMISQFSQSACLYHVQKYNTALAELKAQGAELEAKLQETRKQVQVCFAWLITAM